MRKVLLEALKKKIQSSIDEKIPQFQFYSKSMKGDEKGLLRYKWQVNEILCCYIVFRPLSSEGFDIRVGWSSKNRCPELRGCQGDKEFLADRNKFLWHGLYKVMPFFCQ